MRKRGKSRFSSGTKRALRFRLKYATDPLCHRAKVLLPVKYAHLKTALINLDDFEITLFSAFEAEGIPSELWPFYMAWAKRKLKKGLKFWDSTFTLEGELLRQEFVLRGLDMTTLNNLEPIVDAWISAFRGVECPFAFCDGWETNDFSKWSTWSTIPFDIVTSPVHHGMYGLKSKDSSGEIYYDIAGTPSDYYVRFYFRMEGTLPPGYGWGRLFMVFDTWLAIYIGNNDYPGTTNRYLILYDANSGKWAIGTTKLVFNQWYCLTLHTQGNNVSSTHTLKLDGVTEVEITGDDTLGYNIVAAQLEAYNQYTFPPMVRVGWSFIDCYIGDPATEPSCNYYDLCEV